MGGGGIVKEDLEVWVFLGGWHVWRSRVIVVFVGTIVSWGRWGVTWERNGREIIRGVNAEEVDFDF